MSTTRLIAAALTAFLILPLAANAQPGLPFSLYAGGGLTMQAGPNEFKDSSSTGYNALAGVGFSFAPSIELIAKGEYTQLSFDGDKQVITEGGDFRVWMFGVDARVGLGAPGIKLNPYFFVGAGFASIERTVPTFHPNTGITNANLLFDEQDELYYNFGGGLQFKLAPMIDMFVQAKYVNISTSPESMNFIPITVGIKVF